MEPRLPRGGAVDTMYVYSKHFLDLFLRRSAWIFLLIQLFLAIAGLLFTLRLFSPITPLRCRW